MRHSLLNRTISHRRAERRQPNGTYFDGCDDQPECASVRFVVRSSDRVSEPDASAFRLIKVSVALIVLWAASVFCPSLAGAGEHYAFLVAVRQYDKAELTSLQYTEKDITDLAEVLKKSGYGKDNLVLMTQTVGANETRYLPLAKNIREQFELLLGELKSDDTLLVAFSGHGVQFKGEPTVYFCPADTKLKDRSTLVSLTAIYDLLADSKKCKAHAKVLLVDACRNDPQSKLSKDASKEIELEPVGITEPPVPPGGIAAFFSCSAGQQSY